MPSVAPAPPKTRPLRTLIVALGTLVILGLVGAYSIYPLWATERNFRRAKASLDDREFASAEENIRKVLAARPDLPEAALLLARIYRQTERYREASKQLDAAQKLGALRESVELERLLLNLLEGGPSGSVLSQVKLAIEANHPEDRALLDALTTAYLDSHLLAEADAVLTKSIERYPDDWYPRLRRAEVREALLKFNESAEDYRAALALRPNHPTIRRQLGALLLRGRKDLEDAEKLFTEQMQRYPNDPSAKIGLAEARFVLGRSDEALTVIDGVLRDHPESTDALALKAMIVRGSDPKAAFELLKRVSEAKPGDPMPVLALSQLAGELGLSHDAKRYATRHAELAATLKQLDDLGAEVRQKPHDPEVRRHIGDMMLKQARTKDALGWYFSALREDPAHAATHESLAKYYTGPGADPRLAEYHHTQAIAGRK